MRIQQDTILTKAEKILFSLLVLFLPTQLGKHFWPEFSIVNGLRIDYLSPTFYVTDILVFLLFLAWLVNVQRDGKLGALLKRTWKFKLYLFTSCYLLLTILLSNNIWGGLHSFVTFLEMSFIAFYVATQIPSKISLQGFTRLLAIGVVVESLIAIGQYLKQGSLSEMLYLLGERSFTASTPGIANASINGELVLRAYGTFPHPNVLAGYLVVSMILIFFYLFPAQQTRTRFLAVSALLLGTVALLLTLSRLAIALWVIFIVGVLIWQFIGTRTRKHKTFFVVASLTLLLLGGAVFSQTLLPRFTQTAFTEEAVVQRQVLTEKALLMVKQHPMVGVGLGNFLPTLATVSSPLSAMNYLQPVHNIYLLVTAETGLLGLALFIWFLGKTLLPLLSKQRIKQTLPMAICLSVILITGMVDHYWLTLHQGQLLFAFVLGLSWKRSFHDVPFG